MSALISDSHSPGDPPVLAIGIVEDDDGVREDLATLINSSAGFRCLGACRDAESALVTLPKQKLDVVLMDVNLPRLDGIDCVRRLKRLMPGIQVLMLTVYDEEEKIFEALKAGASGYLLKRTPPAELLQAIIEVHRGGGPMSSSIARKVIQSFQPGELPAREADSLSKRELEILTYLSKGYFYKEIADRLDVSFETVHTHIGNIYRKLQVRSRTEAIAKYFRPH